jgi:tripartite-type tricarboxylate transporter receptor subunit TctC
MRVLRAVFPVACAIAINGGLPVRAEDTWPTKPITIISPYAPGGPLDLAGRPLAKKLSELLGQSVIVENVGGASTMIGAERAANAAADGHTLFMGAVTTFSINPQFYGKIRYKVSDFEPISMIAKLNHVLMVTPSFPAQTFNEFVENVRKRPGEVFFATAGKATTNHLLGELLNTMADIQMVDVAYKGTGPSITDVINGRVPVTFQGINTAIHMHRSGQLRALAVTSEKRSPALPETPSFAELGFPGMTTYFWFGLFAPAGTPKPIIQRLNEKLHEALQAEDIRSRLLGDGLVPDPGTPEQLAAAIQADAKVWEGVIKASGLKPDN